MSWALSGPAGLLLFLPIENNPKDGQLGWPYLQLCVEINCDLLVKSRSAQSSLTLGHGEGTLIPGPSIEQWDHCLNTIFCQSISDMTASLTDLPTISWKSGFTFFHYWSIKLLKQAESTRAKLYNTEQLDPIILECWSTNLEIQIS